MHEAPHYRLRRLASSHPFESSDGSEGTEPLQVALTSRIFMVCFS